MSSKVFVKNEFSMILFLTKLGMAVIIRMPIVWTASSLRQWLLFRNGAHAGLAYVKMGITYIFRRLIRVFIGSGLWWFRIGFSIPRILVAFLTIFEMWTLKFSRRPIVTPKYFTLLDHFRGVLLRVRVLCLGLRLLLKRTAMVFEELIRRRHFLNHSAAKQICLCS